MTKKCSVVLLLLSLASSFLSAQRQKPESSEVSNDYVMVEWRDQDGNYRSRFLQPVVSREERETKVIGRIEYSLIQTDYEKRVARIEVGNEEIVVPIKIFEANRITRKKPVLPAPTEGVDPNRFVDKRTEVQIRKHRQELFQQMEAKRKERVPAKPPVKDLTRPEAPSPE